MALVRYRTGLVLNGMYCSFCGTSRKGKIFQEGARWMARLSCGHISFKGWVNDPDEMERLGYVNAKQGKDPRIESNELAKNERRLAEAKDRLEREMKAAGYGISEIKSAKFGMDRDFARVTEQRRV